MSVTATLSSKFNLLMDELNFEPKSEEDQKLTESSQNI